MLINIKRIYAGYDANDGLRILVDRLWPRGISKRDARLDYWAKELSPSNELRKRYHTSQCDWDAFKREYFQELDTKPDELSNFYQSIERHQATLLYSSREQILNNAVALREYISQNRVAER